MVWNLGVTVAKAQFRGDEADVALEMLSYLEAVVTDTGKKLEALGVNPKTLVNTGRPEEKPSGR